MPKPEGWPRGAESDKPKTWQEIVKTIPVTVRIAQTSPKTLALRAPHDYTTSGRPTADLLRRRVAALPAKSPIDPADEQRARSLKNRDGAMRRGLNRADKRRLIRDSLRHEERDFAPKTLPAPIWRNVNYAFRRFNPEGLATNLEREAA